MRSTRQRPVAGADRDAEEVTRQPGELTRGIVELAAERLAASAAAAAAAAARSAEPSVDAAGLPTGRSGTTTGRPRGRFTGAGLGSRAQDSAGSRPGVGSRPSLASRPPAGPIEAVRPSGDPARLEDVPAAGEYPAAPGGSPPDATAVEQVADYPHVANRPATGLPASLRLPAELPDNLWPPQALLERNATENVHIPSGTPATADDLPARTPPAGREPAPAGPDQTRPAGHGAVPAMPGAPDRTRETGHAAASPDRTREAAHGAVPAMPGAPDRTREAGHGSPSATPEAPTTPDDEQTTARRMEAGTEELAGARLPRPLHPAPRADEERERGFLPTVLARGDDDAEEYVPAHSRATTARHAAPPTINPRTLRRRRGAVLLAYVMVVAVVLMIGHQLRGEEQPAAPQPEAAQRVAEPMVAGPTDVPAATPQAQAEETQAEETQAADAGGAGEFRFAKDRGPMLGSAGRVHRFRVAVEKSVNGPNPADFAAEIDRTLGDERSWIAEGDVRLRRVPRSAGNADFTIYLASAETSEQMCATGGLQTEGFTSCRVPGKVIINADRWAEAIPDYEGHRAEYRRYAINHEVGHELGHGHERCPGKGEPAPVMMQQTFGLKGCTRNAWPYRDGERYAGEPLA